MYLSFNHKISIELFNWVEESPLDVEKIKQPFWKYCINFGNAFANINLVLCLKRKNINYLRLVDLK